MSLNTALLGNKSLSRVYIFQAITRPFLVISFVLIYVFFSLVLGILLLVGKETIGTTSALIMTLIGSISPLLGAQILGRSYEKVKGRALDVRVEEKVTVENQISDNVDDIPKMIDENDPFAELNAMDLKDYMPKVADDNPVIEDK